MRSDPHRLPSRVLSAYQDSSNRTYLSIVSVWEMQINQQIGKLRLDVHLKDIIEGQCDTNLLEIMPLRLEHIYGLHNLLLHYKDPFDRLLIVQSHDEKDEIWECA